MDGLHHLFHQSLINEERLETLRRPMPVPAFGEAGRLRRRLQGLARVARDDTRRRTIESVMRRGEPMARKL